MTVFYTVPDGGRTVNTILRRELMLSASLVRRLKSAQGIFVDGRPVYTNYVTNPGETVSADVTAGEPLCDVVPERGSVDIIWETEYALAVNKPAGLIVHPSRSKYTGTLANYVSGLLLDKYGDSRCHAVNRLDRDTSGIVVFARCGHVKDRLTDSMKQTGEKEYTAVVCGRPPEQSGTVDAPIRRYREMEMLRIVSEDGQRAVTRYSVIKSVETEFGTVSILRLILETGRTHQIRVHMKHLGCPILGDGLYFSDESRRISDSLGIDTQLLHAGRLTFFDPFAKEQVTLTAEPDRAGFKVFY